MTKKKDKKAEKKKEKKERKKRKKSSKDKKKVGVLAVARLQPGSACRRVGGLPKQCGLNVVLRTQIKPVPACPPSAAMLAGPSLLMSASLVLSYLTPHTPAEAQAQQQGQAEQEEEAAAQQQQRQQQQQQRQQQRQRQQQQ